METSFQLSLKDVMQPENLLLKKLRADWILSDNLMGQVTPIILLSLQDCNKSI